MGPLQSKHKKYIEEKHEIEKSPGDKNDYDCFTLKNRLQVLLIQDNNEVESKYQDEQEAKEAQDVAGAYVSLSVNVGSFNDS